MDILQKTSHALIPNTNTYQCKKKKTMQVCWCDSQLHIFSEILMDILWNTGLDSLDAEF